MTRIILAAVKVALLLFIPCKSSVKCGFLTVGTVRWFLNVEQNVRGHFETTSHLFVGPHMSRALITFDKQSRLSGTDPSLTLRVLKVASMTE